MEFPEIPLAGHADAEAALARGFSGGALGQGWIISGPRGIGKATLARRFARDVLCGGDETARRRFAAGSHAGLKLVAPVYDPKKEEHARDITVAQAREIGQFLSLTAGEGGWRAVIVDAADDLNVNAANALLKILEEPPPQSVFLLISHHPGRLLPTIRSRCRHLRLTPLDAAAFDGVMRNIAPEMSREERDALRKLSDLSPGVALELREQGALALYQQLIELLSSLPALDAVALHAFADTLATGKIHANWRLFTRLALRLLERITLNACGFALEPLSEAESSLLQRMESFHTGAVWAAKWQQVADQFLLAERAHLDYKQLILLFFHSIPEREEFRIGSTAA